jgi:hypothetical protein
VPQLSDEQRLFFESQGYLMIEDALPPSELAELRAAADRAEVRWRADLELPGTRIPEFEEIEGILEYDPLFSDLAEHPRVFPLIRETLSRDIRLIDHAYYMTRPGGHLGGSAWHTDTRERLPGVYHPRSLMMVRAMWALEDIPKDGGATLILPGSHRYTDDIAIPEVSVPEEMPGAVSMACSAGSVYFFNGDVLHSPGTHHGTAVRRVVLFNYGHKWMRMWKGHDPLPELAKRATTPMRRQLLGLTGGYYGEDALLEGETPSK